MGAGSITSNVKSDKTLVVVKNGEEKIETGLKKMGAMLGDHVEVGCNSVLNRGAMMLPKNSDAYRMTKQAAKAIQSEAEKAVDAISSAM